MACTVTFVQGLAPNSRRGIAFLEIAGERHVNAKSVFDGLPDKPSVTLLADFNIGWMGRTMTIITMVGLRPRITASVSLQMKTTEREATYVWISGPPQNRYAIHGLHIGVAYAEEPA